MQPSDGTPMYGSFIGAKEVDHRLLSEKLHSIINSKLYIIHAGDEQHEILSRLSSALMEDRTTDVISTDKANINTSFSFTNQEWNWLSRHPESMWLKYMLYRYRFRVYPDVYRLTNFPTYLLIEPTSACNLRCIMCFQVDPKFTQKKNMGMMSWDLFERVLEEVSNEECQAVTFASRGEPTLHPRFGDMLLHTARAKILDIKINTNATKLPEKLIHDILSAGVSEVVFSVDAGTKQTYEEIRVGGVFETVLSNIKFFNEIRVRDYPNSPTVTRIAGVKVLPYQDEEQMAEFWSQYVDEVVIKGASPRWDTYKNKLYGVVDPCRKLWRHLYVWWDGIANPCDFDYLSHLKVGDVNKQSIRDIWHGDAMQALRADHKGENRDCRVPCDRCPLS